MIKGILLILFGYSRGAAVVLEMLKRHLELKSRALGLVTYGGVIQGTHVARSTATELRAYLGKRSIAEVVVTLAQVDYRRRIQEKLESRLSPRVVQNRPLADFD